MVEMLVSLAIIALLSVFFIVNYNSVNSRIALDTQANEVALWIREAQAYAMGVRPQAGFINTRTYGVFFDSTIPGSFVLYVDRDTFPTPKRYDVGGTCGETNSECVKVVTLPQGMTISGLSGVNMVGTTVPAGALHVAFTRPKTDALIVDPAGPTTLREGTVTLRSPKGYTRRVTVTSTGQIYVQ